MMRKERFGRHEAVIRRVNKGWDRERHTGPKETALMGKLDNPLQLADAELRTITSAPPGSFRFRNPYRAVLRAVRNYENSNAVDFELPFAYRSDALSRFKRSREDSLVGLERAEKLALEFALYNPAPSNRTPDWQVLSSLRRREEARQGVLELLDTAKPALRRLADRFDAEAGQAQALAGTKYKPTAHKSKGPKGRAVWMDGSTSPGRPQAWHGNEFGTLVRNAGYEPSGMCIGSVVGLRVALTKAWQGISSPGRGIGRDDIERGFAMTTDLLTPKAPTKKPPHPFVTTKTDPWWLRQCAWALETYPTLDAPIPDFDAVERIDESDDELPVRVVSAAGVDDDLPIRVR